MEACLAGYKVFFATVPSLINQLKESRSDRTLRSFELKFEKYDLVIIDELGYISFDKEGAELLFTHLSLRAGRKSTIITSNLPFTKWNEVFHDQVLTAALTDRLTHKSHMFDINGPSFRMSGIEEWLKKEVTYGYVCILVWFNIELRSGSLFTCEIQKFEIDVNFLVKRI